MLPRDYPGQNCSVARSLEVLGDRWTLLIVREALRGVDRFDGFEASLGVAKNVLADRLARLCAEGILERFAYQERPARHGYRPTAKGRALYPVLVAVMQWGDRYYAPAGPPRIATHRGCDGDVESHLTCRACGQEVDGADIVSRPGPGIAGDSHARVHHAEPRG